MNPRIHVLSTDAHGAINTNAARQKAYRQRKAAAKLGLAPVATVTHRLDDSSKLGNVTVCGLPVRDSILAERGTGPTCLACATVKQLELQSRKLPKMFTAPKHGRKPLEPYNTPLGIEHKMEMHEGITVEGCPLCANRDSGTFEARRQKAKIAATPPADPRPVVPYLEHPVHIQTRCGMNGDKRKALCGAGGLSSLSTVKPEYLESNYEGKHIRVLVNKDQPNCPACFAKWEAKKAKRAPDKGARANDVGYAAAAAECLRLSIEPTVTPEPSVEEK